jgi:hypothetical protein
MGTDYISTINSFLKSKVSLAVTTVYQDVFPDDAPLEIITRHDTTATNIKRYFDGKYKGTLAFTYYVKSKKLKDVQEQCAKIISTITGKGLVIDTGLSADIELKSEAYFVSQYETGEFVYCVPFSVQFMKE